MGKSLQRDTERTRRERREMYLLLILLVSPAFGRPSSDRRDVGANIENHLENLLGFSRQAGKLLSNSKLLVNVSQSVEEAENNVYKMQQHLKSMQSRIPALEHQEDFFPEYNEAKSFLRQTRQGLRELAQRTKTEVDFMNIFLDALDLDKSDLPVILKASVDRLKILMVETKERLEEAKEKYNSAKVAYDNLVDSLTLHKTVTADFLKQADDNVTAIIKHNIKLRYQCYWASVVTLGLCNLIHHFVNEVPLKDAIEELEDLKEEIDTFMRDATDVSVNVEAAIEIVTEELNHINYWETSADQVSENIDEYPEEYLREYPTIRDTFRTGLNDLYEFANQFLEISSK